MILSKKVVLKVPFNKKSVEWYNQRGYECKSGDSIEVDINDLQSSFSEEVIVECNYCKKEDRKRYNDYLKSLQYNKFVKKYACENCRYEKKLDEIRMKQELGIVTRDDSEYWWLYENVKNEIKEFFCKNKSFNEFKKHKFFDNVIGFINNYNRRSEDEKVYIEDILEEIGYTFIEIDKLKPHKTRGYFKNFKKIEKRLYYFINIYDRFPTKKEIIKDLRIDQRHIDRNGGINGLKKKLNYNDRDDLIDNRGDINRSMNELITANWFIAQGLMNKYKRERLPFPKYEGKYRSDFTFYLENKELHIEVYGIDKGDFHDSRAKEYQRIRKIKEELYKKYEEKIIYIPIDAELFKLKLPKINRILYDKFKKYLKLDLRDVEFELLIQGSELDDDVIFKEIMKLSKNDKIFPTVDILKENKLYFLYNQILKRGYTYYDFAQKYGKELKTIKQIWSIEHVFEYFIKSIKDNNMITYDGLKKLDGTLCSKLRYYGGITKVKLNFFEMYREMITNEEMEWIINIANNRNTTTATIKSEDVNKAKKILDNMYPDYLEELSCKICGRNIISEHVYNVYCKKCISITEGTECKPRKCKYDEVYYDDNFYKVTTDVFKLTTKGFNKYSKLKIQAYRNYYGMKWVDIVKKYNKFEELYTYVKEEYTVFYKKSGKQNLLTFSQQHKYITYDLLENIGIDKLRQDCGIRKLRYSDEEYVNNYKKVKDIVSDIPLYSEFYKHSSIRIESYSRKYKLEGKVYDEIVRLMEDGEDYKKYILRKKRHKSDIGKKTGGLHGNKIPEEKLENEFRKVFNEYYKEYGVYPSKRIFDKISRYDSSTYRRRFDKSWTEVKKAYGI